MSAEDRVQLMRETNHMLQNIGLQVDYNISNAMETCNDFHQQLRVANMKLELSQTFLSTSVEALEQRLDKDLLEVRRSSVEMRNNLETNIKQSMQHLEKQMEEAITNNLSKLKEKQRQTISDIRISFTEFQQTTVQELTDDTVRNVANVEGCYARFNMNHRHDLMNTTLYLVGADDLVAEGRFRWADGTSLSSSYELWMPNEPNDDNGNEDCVHVHLSVFKMELNDIPCNLDYYYICQYT